MSQSAPAVAIRHLTKSYRRGGQVVSVLENISFDIAAGDFVALMGPSGSGKSTLLNLIAGIDRPDSGELRVADVDIMALDEAGLADWRARNVGFIFQFYTLMPVLTALENVELPLLLTGLPSRDRRERVEVALGMVGLADRMTHYPSELSGGQQQRVAIGRALAGRPQLILADEPTGNLDEATGDAILELMLALMRETGAALLMVTHSNRLASRLGRRLHLAAGKLG